MPLFYDHRCGGRGRAKAAVHVYNMAPVVSSPTEKLSRRVFHPSFRSIVYQTTLLKTSDTGNELKNARVEINEF